MSKGGFTQESQAILLRHHCSRYTRSNTLLSDDCHCLSIQGYRDHNINGIGLASRHEIKPFLIQKHIDPPLFLVPN